MWKLLSVNLDMYSQAESFFSLPPLLPQQINCGRGGEGRGEEGRGGEGSQGNEEVAY